MTFGSHIYLEFLFSAAVAADKVGRAEGEQILNALCEVVPKLRPSQSVVGLEDSLRYIEQLFSIRWVREWLGMRSVPQPPRPNIMNAQKQPLQQGAVGGRGNGGNLTMHDLGAPVANNGIKDNFIGPRVAFNFKQQNQEPVKQVQFAAGPVQQQMSMPTQFALSGVGVDF